MNEEIKIALQDWANLIKPYKKANSKKAAFQIANTFLPFIAIWILMYLSLDWSYAITLMLAVLNSFFLVRIFIIQHDCGHQSFLGSKKWNNRIGWLCSVFTSIPYTYWAKVHSYHHGHTGHLEHRNVGDINLLTVEEYEALPTWRKALYRMFRHPIFMFTIVPIIYLGVSNRFPFLSFKGWKTARRAQIINNIVLLGIFLLLGFTLGWAKFLMVHLPLLFGFGIIAFWFFYVQHQHEATYMAWGEKWDYLLAAIKGSSFYDLPKIAHWLTGNIGYHHIHHLSSRIPNYNLAKCAAENPILQKYVSKITYWESLKTVNCKLWDESQQKMISFSDYYRLAKAKI